MGFKNLTKYVLTCCKLSVVRQLVPQPRSWCSEGSLSVYCCMASWNPQKWIGLRSEHSRSIYFSIKSLRYTGAVSSSTLNVWNRIVHSNLKHTGTGEIYSLLWLGLTRHSAQFFTRCGRFFKEKAIVYSNALPWSSREIIRAWTKVLYVLSFMYLPISPIHLVW